MPKTIRIAGDGDFMRCRGHGRINLDLQYHRGQDLDNEPLLMRIAAGGEEVIISGIPDRCDAVSGWMFGVAAPARPDGRRHIPDWNIYFEPWKRPESPCLVIEGVPDDAVVTRAEPWPAAVPAHTVEI